VPDKERTGYQVIMVAALGTIGMWVKEDAITALDVDQSKSYWDDIMKINL